MKQNKQILWSLLVLIISFTNAYSTPPIGPEPCDTDDYIIISELNTRNNNTKSIGGFLCEDGVDVIAEYGGYGRVYHLTDTYNDLFVSTNIDISDLSVINSNIISFNNFLEISGGEYIDVMPAIEDKIIGLSIVKSPLVNTDSDTHNKLLAHYVTGDGIERSVSIDLTDRINQYVIQIKWKNKGCINYFYCNADLIKTGELELTVKGLNTDFSKSIILRKLKYHEGFDEYWQAKSIVIGTIDSDNMNGEVDFLGYDNTITE